MTWIPWTMPFIVLLIVVAPAMAAPDVFVPTSTTDGNVRFLVSGLDGHDEVEFFIDATSMKLVNVTDETELPVTISSVSEGVHTWSVRVEDDGVNETFTGHVQVDLALTTQLTALNTQFVTLQERIDDVQDVLSVLETNRSALDEELVSLGSALSSLSASLASLSEASTNLTQTTQGTQADVHDLRASVRSSGSLQYILPIILVPLLALAGVGRVQARRRYKDLMVLLLAAAAKSGVTPGSPEFVIALEAFEGKSG